MISKSRTVAAQCPQPLQCLKYRMALVKNHSPVMQQATQPSHFSFTVGILNCISSSPSRPSPPQGLSRHFFFQTAENPVSSHHRSSDNLSPHLLSANTRSGPQWTVGKTLVQVCQQGVIRKRSLSDGPPSSFCLKTLGSFLTPLMQEVNSSAF